MRALLRYIGYAIWLVAILAAICIGAYFSVAKLPRALTR
jgi:hypothetical protein